MSNEKGPDNPPPPSSDIPPTTPPLTRSASLPGPDQPLLAGRYRLLAHLGKGGQGTVYRAFDESFHRVVALKVFVLTADDLRATETAFEEARRLIGLKHEGIVRVFDAGPCIIDSAPGAYVAMEEISGALAIAAYCKLKRCSEHDVCDLIARVADALHAIHLHGQVHRDLKSDNILVDTGGNPRIVDMGLALLVGGQALGDPSDLAGTRGSMAPEQIEPALGPITPRTDLFALGKLLASLASHPSAELGKLVAEMTAIKVADRPASAEAVAERLRAIRGDASPGRPRGRIAWWVPAVVSLIAVTPLNNALNDADWAGSAAAWQWGKQVAYVPRLGGIDRWRRVACIEIKDGEPWADIADRLGTTRPAMQERFSTRPVFGKLVEELANAGAKAVAFDLYFQTPSKFDQSLQDSIRRAGIPVVIGTSRWEVGEQTGLAVPVVPALADLPRGGLSVQSNTYGPTLVTAAITVPAEPVAPSMALLAAYSGSGVAIESGNRGPKGGLTVAYTPPNVAGGGMQFEMYQYAPAFLEDHLPEGAWVSRVGVEVPSNAAMSLDTCDVATFSSLSLADRQQRFANRVVVIGSAREKDAAPDTTFDVPDRRRLKGYLVQTSAIETLLQNRTFHPAGSWHTSWLSLDLHSQKFLGLLAALAGACASTARRLKTRIIALTATICGILLFVLGTWMLTSTLLAVTAPVILVFTAYFAISILVYSWSKWKQMHIQRRRA